MRRITVLFSLLIVCLVTTLQAQAPKPDPEVQKLHVLVGHWTYEGEYKPGPLGPGGKITGVYNARMILGGFFLQAQETEKSAMGTTHNLEVDSYDPVNKNFISNLYQSDGTKFSGTLTVSGNTITWTGTWVIGGKEYQFKEPLVLAGDSMSGTAKGEISADGKTWMPFFEGTFTKVKSAPKKQDVVGDCPTEIGNLYADNRPFANPKKTRAYERRQQGNHSAATTRVFQPTQCRCLF